MGLSCGTGSVRTPGQCGHGQPGQQFQAPGQDALVKGEMAGVMPVGPVGTQLQIGRKTAVFLHHSLIWPMH